MAKSNSSRIEAATRQHVGAVLTSQMIAELVKVSEPEWKGGVYPSDSAYKRTEEGLVPRGKTAYGDGVLEFLAENSFKVLPTEEIVRRKQPSNQQRLHRHRYQWLPQWLLLPWRLRQQPVARRSQPRRHPGRLAICP